MLRALAVLTAILLVTSVACPSALAREWLKTAGWEIFESEDYCALSLEYEGNGATQLTVGKFLDGHATIILTNNGWSVIDEHKYDLTFNLGEASFSGGASTGLTISGSRKGFVSNFPSSFFPAFAAASGFKIYLGETLVDSLTLAGSAAALSVVDRCLQAKKAVVAAADRERRRFSHIADDPFAGVKVESKAPKVNGDLALLFAADAYPPMALRAGEQGRVTVDIAVEANGRASACTVTGSSGSPSLDEATCRIFRMRGRFAPATDDKGQPTTGHISQAVVWNIPIATPVAPPAG